MSTEFLEGIYPDIKSEAFHVFFLVSKTFLDTGINSEKDLSSFFTQIVES